MPKITKASRSQVIQINNYTPLFFRMKTYFYPLALFLVFWSCQMEEPIPTYTLSSTVSPAEAGKITASSSASTYPQGTLVSLTAEPKENWVFKQWEGDINSTSNPLQVTVTSHQAVVAIFVKRDYPWNLKIEGEGIVEEKIITNPSGREYPHGTTVELTPKPKEGWEFDGWAGDLTGKEAPKRITVDTQKNVTAKFIIIDPLKDFFGYRVATNAKQLGGRYWESVPVPMDLMVYKFQAPPPNGLTHNGNSGNVVAGDFNMDGWVDIFSPGMAFAGRVNVTTSFLIWNPSKKIFEEKNLINTNSTNLAKFNSVVTKPVYLNTDDYVDIVIFGYVDEGIPGDPPNPVTLLLSDGKGGYDIKEIITETPLFYHHGGDLGDLNEDNIPDLVVN